MKKVYETKKPGVAIEYVRGHLKNVRVTKADKVIFDGVRHHIPFFEEEINPKYFTRKL